MDSAKQTDESFADRIANSLRRALEAGTYQAGDRLPSEADLTRQHNVSRAVVREAIAALRADGLVEARKGSGVYALEAKPRATRPFDDLTTERISQVIELLELRTACEIEAAALAATRRSAAQVERMIDAHERVVAQLKAGETTREADFEFHLAIAEATQNRRFPEFLTLIRQGIIPRGDLQGAELGGRPKDYNQHLEREHQDILDAIIEGDATTARELMRAHQRGSLDRYKALLRGART